MRGGDFEPPEVIGGPSRRAVWRQRMQAVTPLLLAGAGTVAVPRTTTRS